MQNKLKIAGLVGLGGLAVWLLYRKHQLSLLATGQEIAVPSVATNPFAAPYYTSVPGISDDGITMNGGAPFQSVINVNVNPSVAQFLNNHYIPLFGFVGMTVVNVNKNVIPEPPPFIPMAPPQIVRKTRAAPQESAGTVFYTAEKGFQIGQAGGHYLSGANL